MAKVVLKFEKPNLFDFNKIELSSIHNASVSVNKSSKTISMTTNEGDPYCCIMGEMQLKPNTSYTFSVECSGGYELYIYRPEYGWTGITNSANTFTTGESGKVGYFRIDSLLGVGQTATFSNFKLVDNSFKGLEIDDGSIVALNSLSQSSSDSSSINYGCIANTGSMTIVDFNGNIAKQIKDGTMPSSNVDVDLYVNNNKIQSHITTDSSYDSNTNEFKVSVTNRIADWDILKYKGYVYQNKSATLYEILADVFSTLVDSLDDALSEIINYTYPEDGLYVSKQGTIKEYLQLISIEYPAIEYGYTVRQIVDDICTIAQLQCFIDDNDKIKFISARPVASEEDDLINVDKSIILEDIDADLFVKNKYDGVEISENNVSDLIDYSSLVDDAIIDNLSDKSGALFPSSYTASILISGHYDFDSNYVTNYATSLSYTKAERFYLSGTIYIPIKTDMNLTEVKNISNQLFSEHGDPKYEIVYNKKVNNCHNWKTDFNTNSFTQYLAIQPKVVLEDVVVGNYESSYSYTVQSNAATGIPSTSKVSLTDDSYIKVTRDDENNRFKIDYYILASQYVIRLGQDGAKKDEEKILMEGTIERYWANRINISLYGDVRTISFNEISANSENIDFSKTKADISLSSKLLQTQTTLAGIKMSDIIKYNLLTDYKNGLQSAKLKVVCSDMYNQNGDTVKNWQLGKILENNNIIQLNGKTMRINSRDFVYDGAPEIGLQVLEQKISYMYGLFKNGETVYSWRELVDNGLVVVEDGNILSASTELDGDLVVSKSIKSMSDKAFYNCSLLTNVSLPDTIEEISYQAFWNCSALKTVNIPKSIKKISSFSFGLCSSLDSINYNGTIDDWCRINIESSLMDDAKQLIFIGEDGKSISSLNVESVTIPSDIQELKFTFMKFSSLKSVSIPDNIISIGNYAFANCSNLESVSIPNSVKSIETYAFKDCPKLLSVSIPSSVTKIGDNAFSRCYGLTSISFAETVNSSDGFMSIGQGAFVNCSSLTSVNLPKIKHLTSQTFSGCSSLKYVDLKDGLLSIGQSVFAGCSELQHIYIPSTVNSVYKYGTGPFSDCSKLSIYVPFKNHFNYSNVSFSSASNCSPVLGENVVKLYMATGDTAKPDPYVTILKTTLPAGNYYIWGTSDAPFELYTYANGTWSGTGIDTDSEEKAVKYISLSSSSTIHLRIDGAQEGYRYSQTFGDFVITQGDDLYSESTRMYHWGTFWNCYYWDYGDNMQDMVYKCLPVKYGYTRAQYKSEVGLS